MPQSARGAQLAGFLALSRELPAELGERALLALVQGIEGSLHTLGVRREEALDERAAHRFEVDHDDPAVLRRAPPRHEAASRKRARDLGGVGLAPAESAAQGLQLERATRCGEHHQHREARRRDSLTLELDRQPLADGGLRAQERLERTVSERIA